MSFECQRDSYVQRFSSGVVSCAPAPGGERWRVVTKDTILFPEGGGQPDDRGTVGAYQGPLTSVYPPMQIAGVPVVGVVREGASAVHILPRPLEEGAEVEMVVDWGRRFDHMQQHSAQHLITAIADREFGFKTTSWNLAIGEDNRCFVELATRTLTPDQMQRVESECNEAIRRAVPMTPHWYPPGAPELEPVRSRGLPDDFEASEVRVVEIDGIDSNMCCGTHVSNLSHLQCIKLLYAEGKKGSTLLYYIAGGRVLRYLSRAFANERTLTKLLSVPLDEHAAAIEKLQKSSRQGTKVTRNQLREIAQLLALQHLSASPPDPVACLHRDDGDGEFMNILSNELASKGVLVLVTVGEGRGEGQFLLAGQEKDVAILGPQLLALLGGKGGGRKGRLQGKATQLQNRPEAEKLLREYLQQR